MNRIALIFIGCLLVFFSTQVKSQSSSSQEGALKFRSVLDYIDYYYVDSTKSKKLVEDAIVGMLETLDPHSVYIPKEDLQETNEPLTGNFEGVGIQFNLLFDTITVISPISGGPSEKVGIISGDKIIKIEGKNFAGMKIKNDDVIKNLRGAKGTKVTVSILRSGVSELLDFTITRDKIPLYSIDATYMATPTVGYIKLSRFAQTSMDEFAQSLRILKEKGAKDLILDLNDNGGGYLNIAFEIADQFLNDGKLIVYTEGLKSPKKTYNATSKGEFEKGRVIVLIDEGSASASEIVSGAMQDWDRALLIGRRTFGKGLVQNQFNLPDGSAMRLTIAKYYTPVGRCIQKPYNGKIENYYKDLNNRFKHGELTNVDSIKFPDSLKYSTPNNKIVYGGGGIMPDIFIPIDTSKSSLYYTNLIRKGILNQFTLSYLDKHRKELYAKYPTFDAYKKQFTVSQEMMDALIAAAEKEKIKKDEKGLAISGDVIKLQMKALLARDLWKNDSYYEIINEINDAYQKALEVFKNDSFKKYKINSY
ncbi:MAG TPA: S41 family peptidase [Bacteroidia bacterium]|nr:S41 family peptidase [Bacteroidia bacterium]HRH07682.1 S41 family peptidase [Bacteroidia bacterium]HRH63625.1 S41 family peptidase [Bacteroidia bacterium]